MKTFVITGKHAASGHRFGIEDDATEEQIAEAAFQCAVEHFDFGWEEVKEEPKP